MGCIDSQPGSSSKKKHDDNVRIGWDKPSAWAQPAGWAQPSNFSKPASWSSSANKPAAWGRKK